MATSTGSLTVEQFAALPRTDTRDELVDGELISMLPADLLHNVTEKRLVRLLDPIAGGGYVNAEVPFVPIPGRHTARTADVAWGSRERLAARGLRGYVQGAPELVIEVVSPSNTMPEMNRRRREAFDGGCLEFRTVAPDAQMVEAGMPDGTSRTYSAGRKIPTGPLGGAQIPVDRIFGD
ncbi:MAG TPA: Uma2 family endonuclease [Bryobacteraceae bacterium]|nr:Uma2 family endonuclease [Bryobacteraceae bacterium]